MTDDGEPVEWLERQLGESRIRSARGERPPAVEIPDPARADRVLTALSRGSSEEFLTLHDNLASAAVGRSQLAPVSEVVAHNGAMLGRGVAVREILTTGSVATLESAADVATSLEQQGGQVRLLDDLPFKVALVDRTVALLPLRPEDRTFSLGALLVRDPTVVGTLHAAARAAWAGAGPLTAADQPPPALRPVLDMLLDGRLDATAARHLGISARTYSRRVRDLLTRLDATTRPQAILAARRRGWIPD